MDFDGLKTTAKTAAERAKNAYDRWACGIKLPPIPHPFQTEAPPEHEGRVLVVPRVFQADSFSCGAIAGWTVIKAIYPERGRAEHVAFYGDCNPHPDRGTPTTRLVKALRAHGVRVSLKRTKATFEEIRKAIDSGAPVIACIEKPRIEDLHWVTIFGYRKGPKRNGGGKWVYLSNNGLPIFGSEEDRVMPFERFTEVQREDWLVCTGKTKGARRPCSSNSAESK